VFLNYKFGKLAPKLDSRTLKLSNYLSSSLPPPPDKFDVLNRVYGNLNFSDTGKIFPMDGNDQYGDCTIAALAHADTVFDALGGERIIMSEEDVIKLYFDLSGGEDSGLVELDVLKYWKNHSINKDKILAYVNVNPHNHEHVKQSIFLFGGNYLGFSVPTQCMDEFEQHKVWTPGKNIEGGHAVYAVAYDSETVTVLTWGAIQKGLWDWWDNQVDEAWAILPEEAKQSSFALNIDFVQLEKDLRSVRN
jgi:hypothetical protein